MNSDIKKHFRWQGFVGALAFAVGTALLLSWGGSVWWRFEVLAFYRFHLVIVLSVCVAFLLMFRKWVPALVAGLLVLVHVAGFAPYYGAQQQADADRPAYKMILLHLNEGLDPLSILEMIDESEPDVIVCLGVQHRWIELFQALDDYPYGLVRPRPDRYGVALISRRPVHDAQALYSEVKRIPKIIGQVEFENESLWIIGGQTLPLVSRELKELRDTQLAEFRDLATGKQNHVMVAGDFNAVPWGRSLRDMMKQAGLTDSMKGWGLYGTWPMASAFLRIPLDHVYVSRGIVVTGRELRNIPGVDHAAVVVEFQFAPGM